jgi:hypothetical protein
VCPDLLDFSLALSPDAGELLCGEVVSGPVGSEPRILPGDDVGDLVDQLFDLLLRDPIEVERGRFGFKELAPVTDRYFFLLVGPVERLCPVVAPGLARTNLGTALEVLTRLAVDPLADLLRG